MAEGAGRRQPPRLPTRMGRHSPGWGIADEIPATSTEERATASTLRNLHLGFLPYLLSDRRVKRPPSQRTAKRLFTSDGDSTGDDRAGQRCRQWPRRTLDPEQPSPPPCWWRY